jgi:asparagine synthase (glutamine-hydrolysing)
MWSMAIYDINAKKLVLSRDRFGVKPLYYFISENVFYFGSEIKQFTSLPSWNPKINPERVFDFLKWGLLDHTNETMFKYVKQLSPGSHMIIDLNENGVDINDSLKISKWYNLKSKIFNLKNLDFALHFKKLFHNSVKLRMVSDVAVGSCLSGGLDSSAIVCQMNQIKSDKNKSLINTFSACSEFEKYDERNWIQFVTDYANVNSNYIFPELSNLYLKLDEMTWHQDEPFGSTSIFAQWCVFKEASKSNVKVILDGQGGDEVLCGYKSFFTPYLIELVKKLKLFSFVKEVYFLKVNYGYNPDFQRIVGALLPHKVQLIIRKNLRKKSSISYINTKKLGIQEGYSGYFSSGSELYSLKEASRDQITNSPVPRLLHWEDRNSMAHSVESRVPFLDYKLVEFCLALPNRYKINNGITKVILRNSLKEIMPNQISNRMSKLGFETPEEIWMKSNKDAFRNLIDEAILNSKGIINREVISMFNDIIEGRAKFSFELWRIISFGRWMKIFEVKTEELT